MKDNMIEFLAALTSGSFVYTFLTTRGMASKSDISKLVERVDKIYELLLEKQKDEACK